MKNDAASALGGAAGWVGGLSALSGLALLVAPRRLARFFGLPKETRLARAFGVRDVVIGAAVLAPWARRLGYAARAASDVLDFTLIAREARRRGTPASDVVVRLAAAVASAAVATRLARE